MFDMFRFTTGAIHRFNDRGCNLFGLTRLRTTHSRHIRGEPKVLMPPNLFDGDNWELHWINHQAYTSHISCLENWHTNMCSFVCVWLPTTTVEANSSATRTFCAKVLTTIRQSPMKYLQHEHWAHNVYVCGPRRIPFITTPSNEKPQYYAMSTRMQ